MTTRGDQILDRALSKVGGKGLFIKELEVALAEEDAAFRKRQGRWTRLRLFPVDRYEQAYRKNAINPFDQTEAFRRAGAATPSAPPEDE